MSERQLFAWYRQFIGTPNVFRAYVRDRATGAVVKACPHEHRSRTLKRWDINGRVHISGGVYAERCAQKMLRSELAQAPTSEGGEG